MARFERISMDSAGWEKALSAFPDRIVFQSAAWLSFLAETQKAEPVLAALKEGDDILGYFAGLIVQRFGLRILGSPFRGWSSPYMGFNVLPSTPRRIAAEALSDFAFKELRCIHFEVTDSHITLDDIDGLGFTHEVHSTVEIDLTQSEEDLFGKMSSSCRRNIRQAERCGVVIEEANGADFAEDYSAQLRDVYAKQGQVPHYGAERVLALIKHVHPTGRLLLLRARNPEGRCIATGVFPAMNQTVFYWGGTSWRQYQELYPNHLLHWCAIRYWKKQGMRIYNMVGTMEFKRRFGGRETAVPMISKSKYRLISRLRPSAPEVAKTARRLTWRLKTLAGGKPSGDSIFERMGTSLRHRSDGARQNKGKSLSRLATVLRLNHWMIKAAAQKFLSLLPGGEAGNEFFRRYVTRSLALDSANFEGGVLQCRRHLESYFAIAGRSLGGFTVLELGSGWYPILPIGMYLCGASHVTTVDIQPGFTAKRVRAALQSYCQYAENGRLESLLPWVDRERVHSLLKVRRDPSLRSVEELLRPVGISAKVGDARNVELDSEPIDFFFSNSVLQYVPADALRDMFKRFRRLAAPGAAMSHYIYLGDPFIGFDPATTPYNFLRYSSRAWRLIDNSLKPHNRLRVSDYCRLHREAGWTMQAEDNTLGPVEDLRKVPLAKEFYHYSQRDLLAVRSWLAFRCDQNVASVEDRPEIGRNRVRTI